MELLRNSYTALAHPAYIRPLLLMWRRETAAGQVKREAEPADKGLERPGELTDGTKEVESSRWGSMV